MHPSITLLTLAEAVFALVILQVLRVFYVERRYAAEARRRGCKPPPKHPNELPFGIEKVREALRADREKRFPEHIMSRFASMGPGVTTLRYSTLGQLEAYTTIDPKNIQAVLATKFNDFSLGARRRDNFFPLLGNGIFTQDGKSWEHSRAMMKPQFNREQVSDLDLEEKHVQNMMRALPVDPKTGWTDVIDLQVLFFRLTLDSATEFLFGESVDSQIAELSTGDCPKDVSQDEKIFAQAFDCGQAWLATRVRMQGLHWLVNPKEFRTACKRTHAFVDHFVRLALSQESKENTVEKGHSSREKYVFLNALAAQTRDPIELRSQLLNILLAGRDTTASLLGWLFYLLTRHPRVFNKLRAIILDEFGTYARPREITFARLKSCTYLQHCNNETLRLYPVVPFNGRQAARDTTLPRGGGEDGQSPVFVRKGQVVEYSVHVMHHRKDLYGPDAEEFRPERWETIKPGWGFLPFNGGPRICIGQQFALTETSYVTVRLMQRFDALENHDPDPVPKHHLTLISCSATGVKIRMKEAA
ncbi:MAG: hypothetical protein M1817_004156 [Caeruleum heppii]|nr:MAG: hypothetical protein M1817_004156 [Caeruleum heppii]